MELVKDIKLVVFDFDGTLFHLDIDWDKLRSELKASPDEKTIDIIWRIIDEKDDRVEILNSAEIKSIGERQLDADVIKLLNDLISRGIKVAIFTRNSRQTVEAVVRNSNLEGAITIVGREDVVKQKPNPEGLLQLMKQLRVRDNEIIVVGDTTHDIDASRAAGIKVVIIENKRLDFQPEGADDYIAQLKELAW